jgi:hypothetical protein
MYVRLVVHTFFKDASIQVNKFKKNNNCEIIQTTLIVSVIFKSTFPAT